MIKKKILTESYGYNSLIREIVRDIVSIYKHEKEGEFYLPEDIDENRYEYESKDLSMTLELILEMSDNIDDFIINADYYSEDDVVVVKIIYNPINKTKNLYRLIGELNELISHELRHGHQKVTGKFDLKGDDDTLTGYEYYTQPHELDAQYYGFKRMSKITRKPFELLVTDWFKNNKDIHQMSDSDSKKVIDMILKFKP
jgi:hypothetical protein